MRYDSTILVVDDEKAGRDVLETLLTGEGYNLTFASTGLEALSKASEYNPDLILLDVMMPGVDGFEVCRRLRADPILAELPVIMVTAPDDRDSRLRGIEAGADDVISKPFDPLELRSRVRTVIRLNCYSKFLLAHRQLESKIAQLSALYDVSSAMNSIIDRDILLKSIIERTKELLNAEGASILFWDRERDELYFPVVSVEEEELERRLMQIRFPTNSGIAGWVVRECKPVLVPDVSVDERFYKGIDKSTAFTTKSILCVPLRGKENILGVLEAVNKKEGEFTEDDQELLEAMADNVAVSIERADLYRDLRKAEALLRRQNAELKQTIEALQTEVNERKRAEEELRKAYTQLEEAQQGLIQSEKLAALGRFASSIMHEVKNPLAIILTSSEFLGMRLSDADPDVKSIIGMLKETTLRADSILRKLLRFSRPSELEIKRVRLNDMVGDTLSLLGYSVLSASIQIKTRFSEEELYIEVDRNQIEQVLLNLLMNAAEAMPGGGDIEVRTCRASLPGFSGQKYCVIEIADTGEGISEDDLPRIFEPFYTTKRDGKGTGLGLPISKTIVDNHGGSLVVNSEVGKGTCVKVILPLA